MSEHRLRTKHRFVIAVTVLAVALLAVGCADSPPPWPTAAVQPSQTSAPPPPTPAPERTSDPLVPTLLPNMAITSVVTVTAVAPDAQPAATATPQVVPEVTTVEPSTLRGRLGVGVPLQVTQFTFDAEHARRLGLGWYLDWHVEADPVKANGLEFAQMVRVYGEGYSPARADIIAAIAANPGSLWLIGNEPDVRWQDNTTPSQYAARYHELYTLIKTLDPSAQVAIGAITQVTPLRLQYIEEVLAAYQALVGQPMPVDVWNIHTFILREERDSWGVSIPPGFDMDQGMLWEIEDHDNIELFQQQVVDFRRWMARNGQRDKPLIVSEYGILMPPEYGFPLEAVTRFMQETFDYLLNARDEQIGYPGDDNRLVQKLAWYSLSDTVYPTGNLLDPLTGELTPLGQFFADYAANLEAAQ
ncbi:MAG: glycosyl hydrolase [Caldilineales bacterium]